MRGDRVVRATTHPPTAVSPRHGQLARDPISRSLLVSPPVFVLRALVGELCVFVLLFVWFFESAPRWGVADHHDAKCTPWTQPVWATQSRICRGRQDTSHVGLDAVFIAGKSVVAHAVGSVGECSAPVLYVGLSDAQAPLAPLRPFTATYY